MLRPFMRAFINDVVLMENTVMQSNLIYTIMRPPFLTNGKFLFDKPPMQTFLVLVTRSFQRTFVGENCVTSAWRLPFDVMFVFICDISSLMNI